MTHISHCDSYDSLSIKVPGLPPGYTINYDAVPPGVSPTDFKGIPIEVGACLF